MPETIERSLRVRVQATAPGACTAAPQHATERTELLDRDRGAVTAEYAIVIMAAVAFAGLLVAIMGSGEVRGMLIDLVQKALASAG